MLVVVVIAVNVYIFFISYVIMRIVMHNTDKDVNAMDKNMKDNKSC